MTGTLVGREIPLDNVKIGATDSADAYSHPNLARPGPRRVHFSLSQRQLLHALLLCQDHRAWFQDTRLDSHKDTKTLTASFVCVGETAGHRNPSLPRSICT